jgi:hypothetical protein
LGAVKSSYLNTVIARNRLYENVHKAGVACVIAFYAAYAQSELFQRRKYRVRDATARGAAFTVMRVKKMYALQCALSDSLIVRCGRQWLQQLKFAEFRRAYKLPAVY